MGETGEKWKEMGEKINPMIKMSKQHTIQSYKYTREYMYDEMRSTNLISALYLKLFITEELETIKSIPFLEHISVALKKSITALDRDQNLKHLYAMFSELDNLDYVRILQSMGVEPDSRIYDGFICNGNVDAIEYCWKIWPDVKISERGIALSEMMCVELPFPKFEITDEIREDNTIEETDISELTFKKCKLWGNGSGDVKLMLVLASVCKNADLMLQLNEKCNVKWNDNALEILLRRKMKHDLKRLLDRESQDRTENSEI